MDVRAGAGARWMACAAGIALLGDVAAARQPLPPLPLTALPLELVGVMTDSADPSRSACLVRCAYSGGRRFASTFEPGSTACDLAEIKEIRQDSVVVRNLATNRLELLTLQEANASPRAETVEAAPAPAPTVQRTSPTLVNVEVPKASIDRYLLNLPELLSSALATPHYADGGSGQRAIDGFQIDRIRAGSVVEQLGLRNGDVILEVNGEKLDSLPTVLRIFGRVQAMTQANLTVLRGGERLTFVFNTK